MKKFITKMLSFVKKNKEDIDCLTSVIRFFTAITVVLKFFL